MKKGFTLVEVIVVVGIIAILLGIVLAQTNKIKQRAEAGARSEFVRQTTTALEMYYSRKGGYPRGSAEQEWCMGLTDNTKRCYKGPTPALGYTGDATLYNGLKQFFPGITSSPQGKVTGKIASGEYTYDAIKYYPGAQPLSCAASIIEPSLYICQSYQMQWYLPGQSQDCSPGYRVSCGTTQNHITYPYDLTYCQLNIPRQSTDVNAC
jgi:prepilin-type N-terminal cleavage/methylation domain-containing protein